MSNEDDDFKQMAIKTGNEQTQLGDLYSSQRIYDKAIQHCARAWKTGGLKYTQVTLFHQGVSVSAVSLALNGSELIQPETNQS